MLSSSEKKLSNWRPEWNRALSSYCVVLELEGCRILSMEEIRQDLIDRSIDCYHYNLARVCVGSEKIVVNIYRREERHQQARRWLC